MGERVDVRLGQLANGDAMEVTGDGVPGVEVSRDAGCAISPGCNPAPP